MALGRSFHRQPYSGAFVASCQLEALINERALLAKDIGHFDITVGDWSS